jgi:hypothetical protein
MATLWVVLDVESIGLHGEGYAAGWVVVDSAGNELDARREACPTEAAAGYESGRKWVAANCPPLPATRMTPAEVRAEFWQAWTKWRGQGAKLIADCGWPVEARFLIACVEDARPLGRGRVLSEGGRDYGGPYPLHELASLLVAAGIDPFATKGTRMPNELPEHDPLADARQSARLLAAALQRLHGERGA